MDDPSRKTVLFGGVEKRDIKIVDYDPQWAKLYEVHARTISRALQDRLLTIEHIGSTSVPGLGAKEIIDIDVIVADSSQEETYRPCLEAAGFHLRVRETDWHEHRMMRPADKGAHIHIFSPGALEFDRHLLFRDYLQKNPKARQQYEQTKRRLATQQWKQLSDYAEAKTEVIETLLARARKERDGRT